MKVLHLSTYDARGGAARAAYRLHTGLRRLGYDSSMMVAHRGTTDPTVMAFKPSMDLPSRWRRRRRRRQIKRQLGAYRTSRPAGYELFSDDRSEHGADPLGQLPPCDVISLHWFAGFLDYRAFFSAVPRRTPVVWTLHDMSAFTGGCHYDHDCGRYTDRCGACPQLGSSNPTDLSYHIWRRKREIFEHVEPERLHIITPSRWLAEETKRSTALYERFPVSAIPNSIDTEEFAPRDRRAARSVLGIPQHAKVVFFSAAEMDNRRKGFALLAQALLGLGDLDDLFLISLGSREMSVGAQIPHLHLGSIDSDRLLSVLYSAADLFVIPSLQDNLPNSVLEAMACGTPVVGFGVGGISEMLRANVTGLLALPQDVASLRAAILQVLADPATQARMAANCRRIAVEEYALEVQARRYAGLYEGILGRC